MVGKYKVITLCGSTRFRDQFIEAQKKLTLQGYIVISVGLFGHSGDEEVWENMDEGTLTETKRMLDDMHKRKIDMADEIFVINVGDYVGESTKSEIEYAKTHGKRVNYLEPHKVMFEEPTDHQAGADVPWNSGETESTDDVGLETPDAFMRNAGKETESGDDSDLETLDAFMRNASRGPEYSEGYSPDEATAALLEYQNGAAEDADDDSAADDSSPDNSLTPDSAEMKKAYALHMLHDGYDVANTAYFLDMDEADVQKILDEEKQ